MSEATPSKSSAGSGVSEHVVGAAAASADEDTKTSAPPSVADSTPAIDSAERYRRISETAYELYAERGYLDGHDVEDWLRAEALVDQFLLEPTRAS